LAARLAQFVRCGKDGYRISMFEFEQHGFALFANACAEDDLTRIEASLSKINKDKAGVRLQGISGLSDELETHGRIGAIAASKLGNRVRPVRAILFDKTAATNWSLGWHQDRTIVVKQRIHVDGFGPWTVKAGLQHVAPPFDLLAHMITIRLHLDPVTNDNAPLLVAVGSHCLGQIPENRIQAIVETSETVACLAQRGDVWLYSTPILHASNASIVQTRRRVLQVDYSADELPGGLEWLGV
jgi:Phytanoyl-CoA dioxygenase (PhyH)